ncbi:MAG: DUF4349 domain-containing protein, partial [Cyanobacteria bacterium P01_G01_bin.4]
AMNRLQSIKSLSPLGPIKTIGLAALAGTALLVGCAQLSETAPGEADALYSQPLVGLDGISQSRSFAPTDDFAGALAEAEAISTSSNVAPNRPQLIRTAQMTVVVDSLDVTLDRVSDLLSQHDGEILSLRESTPIREGDRHSAHLQLRVPQAQLDATVESLNAIGQVSSQSITAEDVSSQIVDYEARLRNLRRGEETVLALFERSGRLSDALEVSRELSNIRSQIEQTEAQLSYLQTRVTYSHITVQLETALAAVPNERSLSTQLKNAWQQSTHSLGVLMVSIMEGGIWVVVYSPFWIAIGVGTTVTVVQLKRWRRRSRQEPVES